MLKHIQRSVANNPALFSKAKRWASSLVELTHTRDDLQSSRSSVGTKKLQRKLAKTINKELPKEHWVEGPGGATLQTRYQVWGEDPRPTYKDDYSTKHRCTLLARGFCIRGLSRILNSYVRRLIWEEDYNDLIQSGIKNSTIKNFVANNGHVEIAISSWEAAEAGFDILTTVSWDAYSTPEEAEGISYRTNMCLKARAVTKDLKREALLNGSTRTPKLSEIADKMGLTVEELKLLFNDPSFGGDVSNQLLAHLPNDPEDKIYQRNVKPIGTHSKNPGSHEAWQFQTALPFSVAQIKGYEQAWNMRPEYHLVHSHLYQSQTETALALIEKWPYKSVTLVQSAGSDATQTHPSALTLLNKMGLGDAARKIELSASQLAQITIKHAPTFEGVPDSFFPGGAKSHAVQTMTDIGIPSEALEHVHDLGQALTGFRISVTPLSQYNVQTGTRVLDALRSVLEHSKFDFNQIVSMTRPQFIEYISSILDEKIDSNSFKVTLTQDIINELSIRTPKTNIQSKFQRAVFEKSPPQSLELLNDPIDPLKELETLSKACNRSDLTRSDLAVAYHFPLTATEYFTPDSSRVDFLSDEARFTDLIYEGQKIPLELERGSKPLIAEIIAIHPPDKNGYRLVKLKIGSKIFDEIVPNEKCVQDIENEGLRKLPDSDPNDPMSIGFDDSVPESGRIISVLQTGDVISVTNKLSNLSIITTEAMKMENQLTYVNVDDGKYIVKSSKLEAGTQLNPSLFKNETQKGKEIVRLERLPD
tara:strand:+ start:2689 stop:4965 length:2277 start_codon:yes stop_codon:yes gene_type:complete